MIPNEILSKINNRNLNYIKDDTYYEYRDTDVSIYIKGDVL